MRNLLAFIALTVLVWGQKKQKETESAKSQGPKIDSLGIRIYQQAARYNDPIMKIYALHHRIATEGASLSLLDTLAQAYFESGFYRQATAVVDDILP